MSDKKTKKAILIGAGAAAAYSFIKGEGIFNKPRFYRQHKTIKKYLSSTHPNANIGNIIKTTQGWSSVINENGTAFLLSVSKSEDGAYIFHESAL